MYSRGATDNGGSQNVPGGAEGGFKALCDKPSGKNRRIRFTSQWDILLLKSVVLADAHISPHGESQKRFFEAIDFYMDSFPPSTFDTVHPPSWKTLNNRSKKIFQYHIEAFRRNISASVII